MIGQLCTSTLNAGKFLEKGLLAELINLVVLNEDNNIKKEAVVCISKVSVTRALVSGARESTGTLHCTELAGKNRVTLPVAN